MTTSKHQYATNAALRRAIAGTKRAGYQLGSVKLHPDGAIELAVLREVPASPANDFDRLEAQGLL